MPGKVAVVTKREYLSRVKTKGFWISTIAIPLLMAAWIVLPSLIMAKNRGSLELVVVDRTGTVAAALQEALAAREAAGDRSSLDLGLAVEAPTADPAAQRAALDARVLAEEVDAWLWVDDEGLAENRVEYHGRNVSNVLSLEILEDLVSRVVREDRLRRAGYDAEQVAQLTEGVDLKTIRISETGSKADAGVGELILAVGLFSLLYMTIIIYGNIVMQGVLEEKGNRIVEVMAATVKPWELMAGKLLGIAAASLTQLAIWVASALVLTAPGLVSAFATMPEGFSLPTISPAVVAHFFALFVLGFALYASFYALLGAAFNNPQEAQQLASFGVVFLVVPWMVFMPVMNDPDGTLAVVMSLIPVFTPLVMMLRIAIDMPPAWQLALGYGLTIGLDVVMIWLCARVYRIGILMYGKRPTLREIWRWMRYA